MPAAPTSTPSARLAPRARRLRGVVCALILVAAPAPAATFTVGAATDTLAVSPGQTFTLDIVARDAGPPFNAFDLDVHFDPARLTNQPMSPLSAQRGELMVYACTANAPYHNFSAGPDSVVGTLVILCSGVSVTGPGALYHLRFTAAAGDAYTQLWFGPRTAFYNGGPRVDTLVARPIVLRIGNPTLDAGGSRPAAIAAAIGRLAPNPAHHPRVLAVPVRLPRAADVEIALLDPQGRRIAGVARARLAAGERSVALVLPPLAPGRYLVILQTAAGNVSSRPWIVLR